MKHAGSAALDRLEPLITRIRGLPGLKVKGRGVFYRGGKAFLHFHKDPAGLFADLRLAGSEFERFKVETEEERVMLFASISTKLLEEHVPRRGRQDRLA